jgi:hypothetical protein
MASVLITLTAAGADTGPFNLYSNTDGYVTAFETNVSKILLVGGYTSTLVPNGTTTIRVKSNNPGLCVNYVDLAVSGITTTTTTSTTSTTTSVPSGFYWINSGLSNSFSGSYMRLTSPYTSSNFLNNQSLTSGTTKAWTTSPPIPLAHTTSSFFFTGVPSSLSLTGTAILTMYPSGSNYSSSLTVGSTSASLLFNNVNTTSQTSMQVSLYTNTGTASTTSTTTYQPNSYVLDDAANKNIQTWTLTINGSPSFFNTVFPTAAYPAINYFNIPTSYTGTFTLQFTMAGTPSTVIAIFTGSGSGGPHTATTTYLYNTGGYNVYASTWTSKIVGGGAGNGMLISIF